MFRWDAISWWATGIFALSLLCAAAVHSAFLYLIIGAYLLRPTLIALGVAKRFADERQRQIQFRSGNLALTVMIAATAVFAVQAELEGKPIDVFAAIIALGIATKALVGLVMAAEPRLTGVRIASSVGILVVLFSAVEGGGIVGVIVQSVPGVVILLIGLLGLRRPLISAILLTLLAAGCLVFFGIRGPIMTRILMELLVTLPLAIAAISLYRSTRLAPDGIAAPLAN